MSDNTIAQSDQPLSLMRHELAAQYRAAGHTGEQAYGMAGFVADDGNASKAGPAGRVSPRGRGLQVCGKPGRRPPAVRAQRPRQGPHLALRGASGPAGISGCNEQPAQVAIMVLPATRHSRAREAKAGDQ